jgi:hypothetical protein
MATTTNYGWTTPDDTALVKDGASAIRSLGTSVDTTTKNLNPSTTLGDIEYRSSSANTNTRLAIGSTGNVLTVAGGVPTWAAPAAGGKVLQVITAETSSSTAISSTSYADTGITATITPSSASSKILVIITANTYLDSGGSRTVINAGGQIVRESTAVYVAGVSARIQTSSATLQMILNNSYTYLDSPATTSATTYKLQGKNGSASDTVYFNNAGTSTITLLEIGA